MIRLCVLATALVATGCGGGDGATLDVFAASSLSEAFPALVGPRYTFAGSDTLATQIREGAEADVFAAASPKAAQALFGEGIVTSPRAFASNRLVIVVPGANEAGIRGLDDLGGNGVRVVIGDQGVPVGDYARQALTAAGADDVLENVVSLEDDVKGVVAKVALGEADAGFVYSTDAKAAADELTVIELPARLRPEIRYVVAVVAESDRREAAEDFVERLLSVEGRRVLREAGFGTP
ncbi:MAG: molybdate ABC transporter substrate-binding protein [Actinobacteria bacterium]|nr:molybdate ABC transporter substrate-binding protein [Actinomycetota bacterium]